MSREIIFILVDFMRGLALVVTIVINGDGDEQYVKLPLLSFGREA